jgi:hypothetical protein
MLMQTLGQITTHRSSIGRRIVPYSLTLFAVLLFWGGLLVGEDALGGWSRGDLYIFHGRTISAFRTKPFLAVLSDYNSATTPLFQILESYNPLFGHDTAFRATNTLFCLFVCALFAFAIRRRFKGTPYSGTAALLIASSLLLSPYFRAQSYWVSTDVFPVFLLILTSLLLARVDDGDPDSTLSAHPMLLIPLLALISWAAFYCRQSYIFLPFYVFLILVWRFRSCWWWTVLVFCVLGLPAVYLVHLWHGLNPPRFRRHEGAYLNNIAAPLSLILIYSLPFLVEGAVRTRGSLIKASRRLRMWWLFLPIGWMGFAFVFWSFRFSENDQGGGIAARMLSHFGSAGRFMFLTIAYGGFLVALFLFQQASWQRRILLVSFLLPALAMAIFFQRYYDPLLVVFFFLLWERKVVSQYVTPRAAYFLMAFNALLLTGAIAYNVKNKPVFSPIFSNTRPWDIVPK